MAEKYLCHKSTDPRKVVPAARKKELTDAYIGEHYAAFRKYDGCQAIVRLYTDGRLPECLSRTGERYVSFMPAAKQLSRVLHPVVHAEGGLVLFCEAWKPGTEFRHISGDFRRHEEDGDLHLVVWDAIPARDYDAGACAIPFAERWARLLFPLAAQVGYELVYPSECWEAGTYGSPQELANRLVAEGFQDGAVFRRMDAGWEKGKENGDESLKIKAEVSLDLRVTAVHEKPGAKTGRPVFTIDVEYRGATTTVGSGMPHQRDALPAVGDIVEVLAMAVNKNNTLREPRYKGTRFDKEQPDG